MNPSGPLRLCVSKCLLVAAAPRRGDHCGEMPFQIKRAYEKATAEDGYRVLVDRLWPRGVAKAEAKIDRGRKEIAPSTALRKWFEHDPARLAGIQTPLLRGTRSPARVDR